MLGDEGLQFVLLREPFFFEWFKPSPPIPRVDALCHRIQRSRSGRFLGAARTAHRTVRLTRASRRSPSSAVASDAGRAERQQVLPVRLVSSPFCQRPPCGQQDVDAQASPAPPLTTECHLHGTADSTRATRPTEPPADLLSPSSATPTPGTAESPQRKEPLGGCPFEHIATTLAGIAPSACWNQVVCRIRTAPQPRNQMVYGLSRSAAVRAFAVQLAAFISYVDGPKDLLSRQQTGSKWRSTVCPQSPRHPDPVSRSSRPVSQHDTRF